MYDLLERMGRKMDYEKFQAEIRDALQKLLPEDYQIEIRRVVKNNNLELDSLNIMAEDARVSPNLYLQQYFQRYQNGEKMQELIAEMLKRYQQAGLEYEQSAFDLDLSVDACRNRIFLRLISNEKNEESLHNRPYIPFLDLAITFQLLLYNSEDGIGSIPVTSELQKKWKLSTKKLFQLAQDNTISLFPKKISYMQEMLQKVLGHMKECNTEVQEESEENYTEPIVVSNSQGINGATVMLYPDCLSELGELCGGDFYILPSSIHEFLVVPVSEEIAPDRLQNMVCDVNKTCVQEDEILSDHIYCYSVENRILEIF